MSSTNLTWNDLKPKNFYTSNNHDTHGRKYIIFYYEGGGMGSPAHLMDLSGSYSYGTHNTSSPDIEFRPSTPEEIKELKSYMKRDFKLTYFIY